MIALAITALLILSGRTSSAVDLLPDLVPVESARQFSMDDGVFNTTDTPGRVYYKFSAILANLGEGPFQIFEMTDFTEQTQDIFQDILDTQGWFRREFLHTFDYETPLFGHLSFDALARYTLYEVGPANEVGNVVATNDKTSHAVVDSVRVDDPPPGSPNSPFYTSSAANPLGISVGYADLYGRNITTQRIDVTGVPSGQYWLEVHVDPHGRIIESDTTNNRVQILVDLTIPTTGDYDQDSDVAGDDFLLWQSGQSPNSISPDDLAGWMDNFGTIYPPAVAASTATVPEPSTAILITLAVVLASRSALRAPSRRLPN